MAAASNAWFCVDELEGALSNYAQHGRGLPSESCSTREHQAEPVPPPPQAIHSKSKPAVRHAEKDRQASCPLANEIAAVCVAEYEKRRPKTWQHRQTVLAAIVARREATTLDPEASLHQGDPYLQVLAFGVGTKFIGPPAVVDRDTVRDMHAEVLARRGFLRYLHQDVARCLRGDRQGQLLEMSSEFPGRVRLKTGLSLHLYTSSVPCGNASWKRWAQGGGAPAVKPQPHDASVLPSQPHQKLQVQARDEGQVSFLTKHVADSRAACSIELPASLGPFPNGTMLFLGDCPAQPQGPLTCSDKIARWNALGLQGRRLSDIFEAPLYMASCTIGRKFSWPHAVRALCCRLQDFNPTRLRDLPPMFSINHPVIMGCSVKFDDGELENDVGADFTESRCLVWSVGDEDVEVLDGWTGKTECGKISRIAPSALEALSSTSSADRPAVDGDGGRLLTSHTYDAARSRFRRFIEERCAVRLGPRSDRRGCT
eukprot:TRINITY_DN29925_c0_g1_i1.p1 TRINITY_DN29925_c0_g1~~TRINITY_DN29925_c0_g1_i1.p1  ORF type:complete len:496 (+),score=14.55 TRINITY_DN29925_c0_g1_i1:37-1488(+)